MAISQGSTTHGKKRRNFTTQADDQSPPRTPPTQADDQNPPRTPPTEKADQPSSYSAKSGGKSNSICSLDPHAQN